MIRTRHRITVIGILLLAAVCLTARTATAQSMSYSAFSDAYGDDQSIFGYGDLEDYGGCAQGSATPYFVEMYSPTRYATGSSNVNMAYSAEDGDWTVVSHFSFGCNCAPFGGSHTFNIGSGATSQVNGYIARYKYVGEENDEGCAPGFGKYEADSCSHQCQQAFKCLPRANGWPPFYEVIGARVFGKCTPGVPVPKSATDTRLCHAGWE
jgi:hypothetical protein